MQKTEFYKKHQKLIYKMAWVFSYISPFDFEDLVSEFNIVFCEAFNEFDKEGEIKFSTFFCRCCQNRFSTLKIRETRLKRRMVIRGDQLGISNVIATKLALEDAEMDYVVDPIQSQIMYDNFVNNPNPVIRRISEIVAIYRLPNNDKLYSFLRGILKKDFNRKDITEGFKQLKGIYEGVR